jgi:KDO2-lipid IV(A) lauroyltransferase
VSWETNLRWARAAADLAFRLDRRHRRIAAENVAHAFPELDADACDDLVRRSFEHLAIMLVETIRAPRVLTLANNKQYVNGDEDQLAQFIAASQTSVPMLVVTGHFGNWEVYSYLAGLLGHRSNAVARRLDNPYLDRFVARFRVKTGMTLLDKETDYQRILDTLAEGKVLSMVGDQDAGRKGLYVDFFGRPASTYKSIALLSLEYGAPLYVTGAARIGHPMKYWVYIEDVIDPAEYADDPDAPRKITERYTAALERMVRRHPEQYFWVHRRWKSYTKYKAKKAA